MQGKLLFTNKDHFLTSREIFPTMGVPAAKDLVISDVCTEGFYGFGVAITPRPATSSALWRPPPVKSS